MALIKTRSRGINLADDFAFTGTITGAGGVTEADQWRLTSDHSFSGTYFITSNWERDDTNFTKIGTGLTESSGVFTFASTAAENIETDAR